MFQTQTQPLESSQPSRMVAGSPVFYGWVILVAGTLGMIMTSPGQTYAVSIFIEHFIRDLGISRSLVSTLYAVGTLAGSAALPFLGRQIDHRGPRIMVVAIALAFGLACIYMGFVRNAAMLGIGFVAIRMLGQGGLGLVSQNVINQWWVRRRGTVMGLSGMLMSLVGLGAFPNLINRLIAGYGWQWAYPILGALVLLVMVPLGLLLFRDQPEKYGLEPDGGDPAVPASGPRSPARPEEHWTLAETVRAPVFWVFTAGLASIGMLSTGLFFHMVSIFEDNGLSSDVAASAFVPIAITTAAVNLGSGLLVDRLPVRMVLAVALGFQALALLMAQALSGVPVALLYGVILGITSGLSRTVSSVVFATYFGRRFLGSITGLTSTIMVAGSALGPMPLGIARDLLGSYNLALTIAAVLPLLLGTLCLFFDRPQRPA